MKIFNGLPFENVHMYHTEYGPSQPNVHYFALQRSMCISKRMYPWVVHHQPSVITQAQCHFPVTELNHRALCLCMRVCCVCLRSVNAVIAIKYRKYRNNFPQPLLPFSLQKMTVLGQKYNQHRGNPFIITCTVVHPMQEYFHTKQHL